MKELAMGVTGACGRGNLLLLGLVILGVGCDTSWQAPIPPGGPGGPVLIEAGGVDMEFSPDRLAGPLARISSSARDRMTEKVRAKFFEKLVLQELIFAQGIEAGLDQDPKIQRQLASHLRQLVQKRVLADLAAQQQVSEDEVAAYYEKNRSRFATRKIRARHILLKDRAQAEKVRAEAVANPEIFSDLAKRHSLDRSSGVDGGDLGFFGYGKMTPDFEAAAFALDEPLEISAVVESSTGFHIIQVTDFRPGRDRPIHEVQGQIRELLLRRAVGVARDEFLDSLRQSVQVPMDPDAMAEAFELVAQMKEGRPDLPAAH